MTARRPLYWVGSSDDELRNFPGDVQDLMGSALDTAQWGRMHPAVKVLTGFAGASVQEVRANDESGTYRAVFTVKLASGVYVLHCFQKKSKRGSETPQADKEIIRARLKLAEALDKERMR